MRPAGSEREASGPPALILEPSVTTAGTTHRARVGDLARRSPGGWFERGSGGYGMVGLAALVRVGAERDRWVGVLELARNEHDIEAVGVQ